jgi:hypothetical protein
MRSIALFSLALTLFTGCLATAPKLTPQQRRALQVRTFEASYDNVFKGARTVLQDEGYIIKNQDFDGGMILAQKETTASSGSVFLATMGGDNQSYVTGRSFDISFSLEKINDNLTETRMTLQNVTKTSTGGVAGKEVVDTEVYNALYNKINVEIQRRKARGL